MGWKNLTQLELKQEMEGLKVQRYEIVKASAPFDNFDPDDSFRQLSKWHDVRSLKSGKRIEISESIWMRLRRLKEEGK